MSVEGVALPDEEERYLHWTPVVAGAFAAVAEDDVRLTAEAPTMAIKTPPSSTANAQAARP